MKHNRILLSITGVFIIPMLCSLILAYMQYTGKTVNKGTWIEPTVNLSHLTSEQINQDSYRWYVIDVCHDSCPNQQAILAGLSTLGTKSPLTQYTAIPANSLTEAGRDIFKDHHIYVADPHLDMILSYDQSNIMDMVADIKRMLKTVATT